MFKRLIFILLIVIVSFLTLSESAFASTLYLTPASGTISVGSTLSVQVRLNTGGEGVNGVSAYLSYPADKLDVVWISYGSAFSIAAEGAYGGGAIRISRGNISAVSGNVLLATIGFRGKTVGSATASFIGGSAVPRASDSSDSLNLGGSTGGTYTISQASAGQTTTGTTPTPTGGAKDNTAPVISAVSVSQVTRNSAKITWKTNKPSDSYIAYGIEKKKYFLEQTNNNLTTDHSLQLDAAFLTPGARIYFVVKSKDAKGNTGKSDEKWVQLKGNTVSIKLVNKSGIPLAQVPVTLYSDPQTVTTSIKGEAVFTNVTVGKHIIVAKLRNNTEKTKEIEVADSVSTQLFTFEVSDSDSFNLLPFALLLLLLIIAAIVGVGIWKRKKHTKSTSHTVSTSSAKQ